MKSKKFDVNKLSDPTLRNNSSRTIAQTAANTYRSRDLFD